MDSYIYPTLMLPEEHWVLNMLKRWESSRKPFLSFPWIKFNVHTLSCTPFWMYFYYSINLSDGASLAGKIEYRVRVVGYQNINFVGDDIEFARADEPGTIWFKCDLYQEIRSSKGYLLGLNDFSHAGHKKLSSAIRSSIPRVLCKVDIVVIHEYPNN